MGGVAFGLLKRPFQNAMHDEVGVTANGRSEMGVFIEAQSKVSERFRRIAGLLERTQH